MATIKQERNKTANKKAQQFLAVLEFLLAGETGIEPATNGFGVRIVAYRKDVQGATNTHKIRIFCYRQSYFRSQSYRKWQPSGNQVATKLPLFLFLGSLFTAIFK